MLRLFSYFYDYNDKGSKRKDDMMKKFLKIICFICLLTGILLPFGCASARAEPRVMDAVIEKIYAEVLYVRETDSEGNYHFVNLKDTVTKNGNTVSSENLSVGDSIQIVFDGAVSENSPGQIKNVYEIILKGTPWQRGSFFI